MSDPDMGGGLDAVQTRLSLLISGWLGRETQQAKGYAWRAILPVEKS